MIRSTMSTRNLVLTLAVAAVAWSTAVEATPLDDYVNTPDSHYYYVPINEFRGADFTVVVINMTSQKWLSDAVTGNPIWWHYLTLIIPDQIDYSDTSFLWIDQGSNHDKPPDLTDDFILMISTIAMGTKTVCGTIKQIPNQPVVFKDDPQQKSRKEDAIIAWTWKTFLDNGSNPEILLRLPMTKSVVRGMDTINTFMKARKGINIDKFVVGGASKRGWTTWTTAAVDKRVIGMVPTVMDLLNTHANLHHHYRSLGGWTFAFNDYYEVNITKELDGPNIPKMLDVIDPNVYKDRYTMPKMIVTASGDEFFLPDDSHYYYDTMTSPKFLRIVPNAEHSLVPHQLTLIANIEGFFLNILEKASFPTVTWQRSQTATGGKIVVTTSVPPSQIKVYHARTLNDKRRDFRLVVLDASGRETAHPVIWLTSEAKKNSDTEYEYEMVRPPTGWVGFFLQVSFPGVKNSTMEFTTEVCIVPDTFPFPDCKGEACRGTLV